jgi:ABC-type sugar transport system substrate-binding protein
MRNSIRGFLFVAAAAALLTLAPGERAFAQSAGLYVNSVDLDIAPGQIDHFLAALRENGAEAVKEPGCREFNIHVQANDPNHVFIYATGSMVAKRNVRAMTSVAFNAKAH